MWLAAHAGEIPAFLLHALHLSRVNVEVLDGELLAVQGVPGLLGRAVEGDAPWDVFMEAVLWPARPNGVPLKMDLDMLRNHRLRSMSAEDR